MITTYRWSDFNKDTLSLAARVRYLKSKNVFGLSRGGMIVAARLSCLLNIPLIVWRDEITNKTLVVDDVCNTGATIYDLRESMPMYNPVTATIFWNKEALLCPTYYQRPKKKYVTMPWESTFFRKPKI